MIILGSAHSGSSGTSIVLEDTFTGVTLDTGEWTSATLGASSTVTQNNALLLTGTSAVVSYARVLSSTEIPTTGIVELTVDWTPGKLYGSTGQPYIMVIPAAPTRESASGYAFPINVPGIRLGSDPVYGGDTTVRTAIGAGLFSDAFSTVASNGLDVVVTCNENTTYGLKWQIDWDNGTLSVWLATSLIIDATPIPAYTPSGAHFLELAFCGYGAASNVVEKFDNLVVTAY